jgi:hypothetical protein
MAQDDADRNLLFGLLALQNNFIDRDDLVDAFHRWMHERAVPLGQILLDRSALKPNPRLAAYCIAGGLGLAGQLAEQQTRGFRHRLVVEAKRPLRTAAFSAFSIC